MRYLSCFLGVLSLLLLFPAAAQAVDYTVSKHDSARAYGGTTLFAETSVSPPRLVEVDMNGKVVWEYRVPSSLARGSDPGKAMDVEWLPATDTILFVLPEKGVFEVDRAGEIVWEYRTRKVSHDADRLPGGNTMFSYGWERPGDAELTEVTPDGKVVWQWRATDHINPDERRFSGPISRDGFCHVNGFIPLDNGRIRISLRNFNMAVEVDRKGNVLWSLRELSNGREARNIHDPRDLPNGNIIFSTHGPQRLFEVKRDGTIVNRLKSGDIHLLRSHQVLPNGNILATDVEKIVELTPDLRDIVWQLDKSGVDPKRLKSSGPKNPRETGFYKAERLPPR